MHDRSANARGAAFLKHRPLRRAVETRYAAALAFVAVAVALIVTYVMGPAGQRTELLVAGASVFAALTVIAAAVIRRPVRPVPWFLLAVGLSIGGVAHIVWAIRFADGNTEFPGALQAIGLLAYPSLFVAMAGITSRTRAVRDPLGGSDSLIYAVSVTALVWLAASGPYLDGMQVPLPRDSWIWAFALLDGLLAAVTLRRLDRWDASHVVTIVLAIGFVLSGFAHLMIAWSADGMRLDLGSPLIAATMIGPLVVGLAVTLPAMSGLKVSKGIGFRLHWAQIVGLLLAALAPLGAVIVMLWSDSVTGSSMVVGSTAAVVVIVLAFARIWRLVGHVRRLTEQRGHERLAAIVEHSSDVVLLANASGAVSYASPGLSSTLGYDPALWSGRNLTDVIAVPDRVDADRRIGRVVTLGNGATVEFETTLVHAEGDLRKATVVIANLIGDVAVDGLVATFRDVTEQRNLERQLSHRAFHDELTGLANRALFLDRIDHALRIARSEIDPVVVLFVDLDDFKSVNDALGHAVGDQVLITIANRIRSAAGAGDTVARLGGDEFALLLEDRGGVERAIDVAERLLDALREPMTISGYDTVVLASVGVAVASPNTTTTGLLRDADIAMYEAKRAGKGQIRIFDPAMRLMAAKHLEYRGDLGVALENDEFRLVYMPFVDIRSGQVVGAEALVRWQHRDHGDIPAADFVPIAERSGLIVPLGYWVLEAALAQLESWRPGSDLFLSINVSAAQIRQPDFVDRVVSAIQRHRVEARSLVLEVTENTLVEEGDRATESVARLREHGVRLAIDDFGAGFCSLSYLQRHPVDLLKIDRLSITEFGRDPRGTTLARTILQMADSLDLMTVAEGIETTDQLRELRRHGCDLGQGHLLSQPLEADMLARRFGQAEPVAAG